MKMFMGFHMNLDEKLWVLERQLLKASMSGPHLLPFLRVPSTRRQAVILKTKQ